MALTDSLAAYDDCFEHFDRAMATPKGIRVLVRDNAAACTLRMRLNYCRVLQRRESKRVYESHDPSWGKSEYDKLKVVIHPSVDGDGKWWVYIEPWSQETLDVEELE